MTAALIAPMSSPAASTATTVSVVPYPPRISITEESVAAKASVEPTERSMPPARITNVIPTAIMPFSETWRRMSVRLPMSRKMISPRLAGEKTHASAKTVISPTKGLRRPSLTRPSRRRPSVATSLETRYFASLSRHVGRLASAFFVSESRQLNDAFLRRRRSVERARESSFAQHDDAGTQRQQFGEFRRDENYAQPPRGEIFDQMVYFGLAFFVNALRRLVQEQHSRIGQQPPRQHDLLLIAAAQVRHRRARVRCLDAEPRNRFARRLFFARRLNKAEASEPLQLRDRDVTADIQVERQPLRLAVFRDERQTSLDRLPRIVDVEPPPVQRDARFARRPAPAEKALQQFRAPRPHQPRDAEHFAGAQIETDARQPGRAALADLS